MDRCGESGLAAKGRPCKPAAFSFASAIAMILPNDGCVRLCPPPRNPSHPNPLPRGRGRFEHTFSPWGEGQGEGVLNRFHINKTDCYEPVVYRSAVSAAICNSGPAAKRLCM